MHQRMRRLLGKPSVAAREKNERLSLSRTQGLYLTDNDVVVAPGVHRVGDTTEVRQRIQQLRLP